MKFSSATTLALFATLLVASVPGQADGRKTRGRFLQDGDGDDVDGEGKGSSMDYSYGKGKGKGSSSSDDEEECVCEGFYYYQFIDFALDTDWIDAYLATPDDCVLAPVGSTGELLEIGEAAKDNNAWVGIMKSAGDIAAGPDALTASWYNLDGSAVPDDTSLWGATAIDNEEPNNDPPFQTRAHWYGKNGGSTPFRRGLRDLNPVRELGPMVTGAVYKCCGLNVDTCYNFPEVEEGEVE
mmetsp:Transcript_131077/g.195347  ORF Transcript_131077/g.195347 Transcript_131077/m.195347 type:complete len:239 (+) Transcript_131077:49-765(+)